MIKKKIMKAVLSVLFYLFLLTENKKMIQNGG